MGWTQFLLGLRYCLYIYFVQYMGIFYMYIYYISIWDGSGLRKYIKCKMAKSFRLLVHLKQPSTVSLSKSGFQSGYIFKYLNMENISVHFVITQRTDIAAGKKRNQLTCRSRSSLAPCCG